MEAERAKVHTRHAIELLRETGETDATAIARAGHVVGTVQVMEALMDRGDGTLKKMLSEKPEAYIRILNLVCRLANSSLRCTKQRDLTEDAGAAVKPSQTESNLVKV